MSFSIRKIGMLEMPKIAMLSTLLNPFDAIDIREEPVKDSPSLYIQEGLGKVLGQGIEPGCIDGCDDEADHELINHIVFL